MVLKFKCPSELPNWLVKKKKKRLLFTRVFDLVALGWGSSPQVVLMSPAGDNSLRTTATERCFQHLAPFSPGLAWPCISPPILCLWLQAPNHWCIFELDSPLASPVSPSALPSGPGLILIFLLPFLLALTSLDRRPVQRS